MVPGVVTRRRALAAGALTGLGALVARPALPALAAPRARGFTLAVPASEFGRNGRTGVLRAPRRFDVVGVRGSGLQGLEVRVRERGGAWSRWVPLGHGGEHRPDTGTGEHASDPVWAGGADELQLRAARRPRRGLTAQFVAVGTTAKRRGARASAATRRRAQTSQSGPPTIVPRSAWGGDGVKPRSAPSYGEVQLGFVHHTVTANDYAPEDSAGIVLGIAKYHRDSNGWNDLGYNFLVDKYGQIFEGRAGGIDQAVIGAQAQGYNSVSTGVALLGTHGSAAATPAALEAIARLLAWKLSLHGAPVQGEVVVRSAGGDMNRYKAGTQVRFERISGHRDGDSTSCPGNALYAQLPQIRSRASQLAPAALAGVVRLGMQQLAGAPRYGEQLEVAGTLVHPDGSPVSGQRVTVQKRGRKKWVTVARATTAADGSWRTSFTWRRAGRVRARAAVPGSPVAVTPTTVVGLTPRAELSSPVRRIRAGSRVALDVRLLPVEPAALLVEREIRGRFRRVAKVAVRPRRSSSRIRVRLSRPGLYRLILRAEVDGVATRSEPVIVRAVRPGQSLESPSAPASDTGGAGTGTSGGATAAP